MTQPLAYEMFPNVGRSRSIPVRYSRIGRGRHEERRGRDVRAALRAARAVACTRRVDAYPASTQYAAEPRAGHSRSGSAR